LFEVDKILVVAAKIVKVVEQLFDTCDQVTLCLC